MNVLKRRLQEADANLRKVSSDLRRAKRRASESVKFPLREPQRTTARILVAMYHGEPTAAMDYVLSKRRRKGLDHTSIAQAETELKDWWRRVDDATKRSHLVMNGASIKMQNAYKQAQRFSVELNLEEWVDDQNVHKGINPSPALVLRQASMLQASKGVSTASSRRGQRRWLQRWRKRRGLQLRKFAVQERLPVDQMQRKVELREGCRKKTVTRKLGNTWQGTWQKVGVIFWSSFWCLFIGVEQKVGPKNGRLFSESVRCNG